MDTLIAMFVSFMELFAVYGPVMIGWLFNLMYMATACVVIVMLLRYLDKRLGLNFKTEVLYAMQEDPKALAIYFAARFIGACILAGLMLGAGGGA